MSLIVGLTGGIATGKSTVAQFFKEENIPVIETDQIAKSVMQKGSAIYQSVVEHFGEEVLLTNLEINRKLLGQMIFEDPKKRELLNQLVHPAVRTVMQTEIEKYRLEGKKLIVADVPLLFEAGFDHEMDVTLVVWTDESTQLKRLMSRDEIDKALASMKIKAQLSLAEKKSKADYSLDNSHSILTTKKAFLEILNQLKERAGWEF